MWFSLGESWGVRLGGSLSLASNEKVGVESVPFLRSVFDFLERRGAPGENSHQERLPIRALHPCRAPWRDVTPKGPLERKGPPQAPVAGGRGPVVRRGAGVRR
ncbi:Hypothetical predicted protein [Podarcis lilfordi]|uniref:Uncharacterized protein n=1 Tax=Podarcis lilfordi TaxID=74358 RepID=A0AA35PS00_9SAUR|nr:Hypothetical predicted protein [Podarcis lilfordi]